MRRPSAFDESPNRILRLLLTIIIPLLSPYDCLVASSVSRLFMRRSVLLTSEHSSAGLVDHPSSEEALSDIAFVANSITLHLFIRRFLSTQEHNLKEQIVQPTIADFSKPIKPMALRSQARRDHQTLPGFWLLCSRLDFDANNYLFRSWSWFHWKRTLIDVIYIMIKVLYILEAIRLK